jgi:hypothetical protein
MFIRAGWRDARSAPKRREFTRQLLELGTAFSGEAPSPSRQMLVEFGPPEVDLLDHQCEPAVSRRLEPARLKFRIVRP